MTQLEGHRWVEVSVPEDLVVDVYELIAELRSEGRPLREKSDEDKEQREVERDWTPELMRRCYRESPNSMTAILEYLGERPGEWVGTGELIDVAGYTERSEIAGVFGAFGRRVKNRYSMDTWPTDRHWSHEDGERKLRLPDDLAEIVLKERNGSG